MNHPTWRQRLSYLSLFVPVRLYLLLFVLATAIAWWWLQRQLPTDPSFTGSLLQLLIKAAFSAVLVLISFCLTTTLLPFLWLAWHIKKRRVQVNIAHAEDGDDYGGRKITIQIQPLWQPLFGFLRYRLLYDGIKLSPKFSLVSNSQQKGWFTPQKAGWYYWPLPAIREYDIEQMLVYFEDLFQFFSFSLRIPVKQSFYTKPRQREQETAMVSPQRTEQENVRIEELKRIEGEYINYKKFEDNDDVRRIVWKIYAKNKELVVRIPEILDPYASHIYMYTSFFDSLGMDDNYLVNTRGLDHFKISCWSLYSQLQKAGRLVKLIPDQLLPNRNFANAQQATEYNLSASNWHHEDDLLSVVPSKGHALICFSSLSSPQQLDQLLQRQQQKATLVFVELSKGMPKRQIGKWLRWIFIKPEGNFEKQGFTEIGKYSTLKQLKDNEALLLQILQKHGADALRIG